VKNDRLGFVVPYGKDGTRRNYLPEFIAELVDGQFSSLKIKGQIGDGEIKVAAAKRWCTAVNNDGGSADGRIT
jgi:type III restriction enzyme